MMTEPHALMLGYTTVTSLNTALLRTEQLTPRLEILSANYVVQAVEQNSKTYVVYTHQHSFYEAHLPFVGAQSYLIDGEEVSIARGQCVLIRPLSLHSCASVTPDLCKFCLSFQMNTAQPGEANGELTRLYEGIAGRNYILAQLGEEYVRCIESTIEQCNRSGLVGAYGVAMLATSLVTRIGLSVVGEDERREQNAGLADMRVAAVERFIRDNKSLPITGRMIAEHMYLSTRQLNRMMVDARGMTLKELIDSVKLSEARRMLTETNMGQRDIAAALGFSEVSSFNRFFNRMQNDPPGKFRKETRS